MPVCPPELELSMASLDLLLQMPISRRVEIILVEAGSRTCAGERAFERRERYCSNLPLIGHIRVLGSIEHL